MIHRRALALWTAAGLAALGAWAWLEAGGGQLPPGLYFCPSRRFLDLPCPGCGMTRALAALAQGEWRAALALHPLAPLVAAQAGGAWILWGLWAAGRGRLLTLAQTNFVLGANAALLLSVWVGRFAAGTLPR
ncbi:MAG TPA: DUF2752 domain-containing protein [Thermoanaerobaculia bacterium]|nr:DUF2752 domain-containing protein [Thermoanaerobaculia bacterium]